LIAVLYDNERQRDFSSHLLKAVINQWNQLYQRAVGASSTNAFKGWLNSKRETRMGFFMD